MYVYAAPAGPSAADLVPLEVWFKVLDANTSIADHYTVGTAAGKADAAASNYTKSETLGYVWSVCACVCARARACVWRELEGLVMRLTVW